MTHHATSPSGLPLALLIGTAVFGQYAVAADLDNDGTVSKAEYLDPVKKQFKQADADNDDTLDAKELSSNAGRSLKRLID